MALAFVAMSVLMARFININTFSLHGMYRDRLVRAYLGASNTDAKPAGSRASPRTTTSPMHALDHGSGAAPRGEPHPEPRRRRAASPGSSARRRHSRSRRCIAATATSATARRPQYGGGITLGTAVAISGAAASPNMGYHSSPVVGFIMTLFNARLGSWLGNPGPRGARTWQDPGPLSAVRSMVKEALGQTSDQSEYVYLSDGGHFENLGLYEMVRRRCRFIVVLDAGCDPDFHVRRPWQRAAQDPHRPQDPDRLRRRQRTPDRQRQQRCAVGTIRYSARRRARHGRTAGLRQAGAARHRSPDVASYAAAHQSFPHEGTGDQWFDESQTESYRSLGLHTRG